MEETLFSEFLTGLSSYFHSLGNQTYVLFSILII